MSDNISKVDQVETGLAQGLLKHSNVSSTTYEAASLFGGVNLSDAHCRQPTVDSERLIIKRYPLIHDEATERPPSELAREFVEEFFALAGQSLCYSRERYQISYSASCGISMVAGIFRRQKKSVALVAPCFDNIPRILTEEPVTTVAVPEADVFTAGIPQSEAALSSDVLWVTSPNNPTGAFLDEEQYRNLAVWCAEKKKILVLDHSFRFFCPSMREWDQYRILRDAGVSFIIIEDTGKTWPTGELKLSICVTSEDLFLSTHRSHDNLLQGAPMYNLVVLREFIRNAREVGLKDTAHHFVVENRNLIRSTIKNTASEIRALSAPNSVIPVEWLELPSGITGNDLQDYLVKWRDIHILPGSNFYWANPAQGNGYVRLALNRPPEMVQRGIRALVDAVEEMQAVHQ